MIPAQSPHSEGQKRAKEGKRGQKRAKRAKRAKEGVVEEDFLGRNC